MTDLSKDEVLAPCPLCRRTVHLAESDDGSVGQIVCDAPSPCLGSGLLFAYKTEHRTEAIAAWNRRAGLAPLFDGKGEAELRKQVRGLLKDWDGRESKLIDSLLPLISARLDAARAEGAAQERERIAASYRANKGEICAWGLPLPEEGPCQCGATDMEQCRWMSLDGEPIRARTEEPTDGK